MAPSAVDHTSDSSDVIDDPTILTLGKTLKTESAPLALRFRALFSLKHLASRADQQAFQAVRAIAAAFSSPSALLKHELAYCLGQTRNPAALPYLRTVLENKYEDSMCRHEAAEALGALGDVSSLGLLRRLRDAMEEVDVVKETCEIAVARIEWENSQERTTENLRRSKFASIDPAPPLPQQSQKPSINELERLLLDTSKSLFFRYRAMFELRDLAFSPGRSSAVPAVLALAEGFSDPSALFRHEIAFVFGQLSHPASIPALVAALSNKHEASMVRHEAAEALGSLGSEEGVEDILKGFLNDPEQVVRDSVVVALDMAEFEKSGETEYALVPNNEHG